MSRETAARDVTLNALALLTGGLTAAAFVGTGLVTGLAADATAQKDQAKAVAAAHVTQLAAKAQLQAEVARRSIPTPRPTKTVVTTTHVTQLAAEAQAGSQSQVSSRQSTSSTRSSRAAAPAPVRAQAPTRANVAPPAPSAAS